METLTAAMLDTITLLKAHVADAGTEAEKAVALNALVWELRSVDPRSALPLSQEAVALARQKGAPASLLAPSLCLLGVSAVMLSRHQEAREALDEGLALSRSVGDRFTEARCLHYIGIIQYCLLEHAEAAASVNAAVDIRQALDDWEGLGASFNILGNIQLGLSDYGQALDWYVQGLEMRTRAGDALGAAGSLNNIGIVYLEMEEYTQAADFHQRGLSQSLLIGNPASEAISLCNLSHDFLGLRRYAEALDYGRRAAALAERLEDWERVIAAHFSCGYACTHTARREEALEYFHLGLKIARAIHSQSLTADALQAIGKTLTESGFLREARAHLAEAAVLAEAAGARRTASQSYQCLSEVCKRQGDYATALGHYEMFRQLEKEVFSEESDKRTKSLVIQMEVEHHRREAAVLVETNAALQAANTAFQEANARLEALATTDPLTGLPNHRALVATLDALVARTRRHGESCGLLFLDIDHFKSFNDTYGHPVGDAVLVEFASCVRACLRAEDTLGRWGGEEFLILLPGLTAAEALGVGERVRLAVAAHPLAAGAGLHMTCSIGAAACPPQESIRDALVQAADQALYAAKRLGRNQVRAAGDPAILALDGSFPKKQNRTRQRRQTPRTRGSV